MRLKFIICLFLLGFSLNLHAYPSCSETKVEVKDPKLKKIFIKKVSEKETKIKFLYGEEVVIANPFFCYTRETFVECLGDDDSGHLILKND